jgi:ribonuclease P protein component
MVEKKHLPAGVQKAGRYYPPNLPKRERLSDNKTLSVLFNNNLRFRANSGPITMTIIPSKEWKMAVLIKKRIGSAVRRNFIKRKIREAFRNIKPRTKTPYAIIFSVKSDPKDPYLNNLFNLLLSTLSQK